MREGRGGRAGACIACLRGATLTPACHHPPPPPLPPRRLFGVFVALNVTISFVVEGFSVHKQRRERLVRLEAAALRSNEAAGGGSATPAADAAGVDSAAAAAASGIRRRASSMTAWARGGSRVPRALAASAAATAAAAAAKDHGLADWRGLLARSGVSFAGWRLAKPRHHMDIYETLYFDEIAAAYADTLDELRAGGGGLRRKPAHAAAGAHADSPHDDGVEDEQDEEEAEQEARRGSRLEI